MDVDGVRLTCIGLVVSMLARKYVRTLYQLLNVSFLRMAISEGTEQKRDGITS